MIAQIRVLVVDDDPVVRRLHRGFVGALDGFRVVAEAASGRAAVELAVGGGVDLVLLDMRMPDVSGVEVLHRLRTVGGASPDVLVISSSRDQVTVRQALAAQVVGYLVKPFTEDALHERLLAYREQRRVREEGARDRPFAQGEIDQLLAPPLRRSPSRPDDSPLDGTVTLPKGIAAPTLERILGALDVIRPLSAADIAEQCALSRPTARRYLDYLVAAGRIDRAHRYGRRGRPEVLYRLAPR